MDRQNDDDDDGGASITSLPPELLQEIVVHVANAHFLSARALARTCRALAHAVVTARLAMPKVFCWTTATHTNVTELVRLGTALGVFEPATMAAEVIRHTMYAVVVWAVDERFPTVSFHRNLPDVQPRGMEPRSIAYMMRLVGLPHPRAAPPAVLLRWITSTFDALNVQGGASLFAASRADRRLPKTSVQAATVGKYVNYNYCRDMLKRNSIAIRRGDVPDGLPFDRVPTADFDLLHTIDTQTLACIANVSVSTASKWLHPWETRCAVLEAALADPSAGRRAVSWIDSQVRACLLSTVTPTRSVHADLLPHLSDLFEVGRLRVARCHRESGLLIGALVPRFDVCAFIESARHLPILHDDVDI